VFGGVVNAGENLGRIEFLEVHEPEGEVEDVHVGCMVANNEISWENIISRSSWRDSVV